MPHVGCQDAVHRGGPHAPRVTPQIGQHGARAVGDSHQVDRSVAESGAHLLEVVDQGVGGVPGEVHLLLQPIPAGLDLVGGQEAVQETLEPLVATQLRADESAGLSGPPQVDQQHVALLAQGGQRLDHVQPPGDRGFSRSTGDVGERIGKPVGAGGREHHDAERDLPARPSSPVFEHLIGAAERIRWHARLLARGELGPARRLRRRPVVGRPEVAEDGEDGKDSKDGEDDALMSHHGLLSGKFADVVYRNTSTLRQPRSGKCFRYGLRCMILGSAFVFRS